MDDVVVVVVVVGGVVEVVEGRGGVKGGREVVVGVKVVVDVVRVEVWMMMMVMVVMGSRCLHVLSLKIKFGECFYKMKRRSVIRLLENFERQ